MPRVDHGRGAGGEAKDVIPPEQIRQITGMYWPTARMTDPMAEVISRKFLKIDPGTFARESATWFEFNTESVKPNWSAIADRCAKYCRTSANDFEWLLDRVRNAKIDGRQPFLALNASELFDAHIANEIYPWTHDGMGNMRLELGDLQRKCIRNLPARLRYQWREYLYSIHVPPPVFLLERNGD